MEIIDKISAILQKEYPEFPVYGDRIIQGFEIPSFLIQLVSFRDIATAGVKFNKVYTLDVVFRTEDDVKRTFSEELKSTIEKNLTEYKLINYDLEFVDNDMHLILDFMKYNTRKDFVFDENSFYGKLKSVIEKVSGKECFYYTTDLRKVNLSKGFYLIKPESIETNTISLNHRKQKGREITLIYLEDSERNPVDVLNENEKSLEKLFNDLEFRKNYINMDYSISVNYETEEDYFTDLIYFNIMLNIKER